MPFHTCMTFFPLLNIKEYILNRGVAYGYASYARADWGTAEGDLLIKTNVFLICGHNKYALELLLWNK